MQIPLFFCQKGRTFPEIDVSNFGIQIIRTRQGPYFCLLWLEDEKDVRELGLFYSHCGEKMELDGA